MKKQQQLLPVCYYTNTNELLNTHTSGTDNAGFNSGFLHNSMIFTFFPDASEALDQINRTHLFLKVIKEYLNICSGFWFIVGWEFGVDCKYGWFFNRKVGGSSPN